LDFIDGLRWRANGHTRFAAKEMQGFAGTCNPACHRPEETALPLLHNCVEDGT
jgi:hypothetical protein